MPDQPSFASTPGGLDLSTLNPAQLEAVMTTEGPLLVLAGAGSGKTRVLTYRIAHMVRDLGVAPWQILAITFTNKAAREMRDRLGRLMGGTPTRGMWVCTFHAMCVRMLRIDAERLGYTPNFTIYDDDDSKRLIKDILTSQNVDIKRFPVNMVRQRISQAKNELVGPEEMAASAQTPPDQVAARAYRQLEQRLHRANAMDFDDLLVNAYKLLDGNTDVLGRYQDRFAYICVDEYQDTNRAQYLITHLLAAKSTNLMVVGDDDQSIYSWRGADIRNILDFKKDYPQAHQVKLEENYRSTGHILDAANAVVAHNDDRVPKRLYTRAGDGERVRLYQASDERDEGRWIAAEIARLRDKGDPYSDMAVFYRTNAMSRILEDMFLRAGVPYHIVGGTRFFDRQEIRDLTAYLKLVVNPDDDVSARRVINKPVRGIGTAAQSRIGAIADERHISFLQAAEIAVTEPGISARARNGIIRFLQLVDEASRYSGDLVEVVRAVCDRSGLVEALENEGTPEAAERVENIREFTSVVQDYVAAHDEADELLSNDEVAAEAGVLPEGSHAAESQPEGSRTAEDQPVSGDGALPEGSRKPQAGDLSLAGFMEWLALRTDLDTLGEDASSVTLMTVHSAKGLEFGTVFVCGMEETVFPHASSSRDARELEEERRLAYVAITRARRRLYLTYTMQRHMFGESVANPRSRFISEIPSEHLQMVGVGSAGFAGTGWEKRGDRHGTFGSGRGSDMYGGRVFGSVTRSTGGSGSASGSSWAEMGGRSGSGAGFGEEAGAGVGAGRFGSGPSAGSGATFGSMDAGRHVRADAPAAATPRFDEKRASVAYAPGDRVSHKVFGQGTVLSCEGEAIQIRFDAGHKVKKMLKGYAPIVKIS